VFALHAELKHEERAALALQFNPLRDLAEPGLAGIDLERVAVRHRALRGNRAHHLLDSFPPFRALLRLKGLEVASEGRNGIRSRTCADQRQTGQEKFVSRHNRIFGLKVYFKSSKLIVDDHWAGCEGVWPERVGNPVLREGRFAAGAGALVGAAAVRSA